MAQQLTEAAASVTRAAHRIFAEAACDVALTLSCDGRIDYATDGAKALLGTSKVGHELRGQNIFSFVQESCVAGLTEALLSAEAGEGARELDLHFISVQGEQVQVQSKLFWDVGTATMWLVASDISKVREIESQLRQLATHDVLTGLPNRAVLAERLEWHVNDSRRRKARFAAVAIDLDGFKRVNDARGHLAGDALLKEISRRIRQEVRDVDTVSRVGGDEFFLVLPDTPGMESAQAICNRIIEAIRQPVTLQGGEDAYVSASLGVAMYPEHGTNAVELIQHADLAMYQSKTLGKNRMTFFMHELKTNSTQALSLETSMHSALRDGEFMVFYQPLVDTVGVIRGCEALLRWQRPDGTWIPPSDFIPVAESTGLITLLGDYVMRAAAQQLRRFDEQGLPDMFMSVNVSPRQLRNANFEQGLKRVLTMTGIKPSRLVLEITENMLMSGQERIQTLLRKVADTGVRFSLDDFGTGYSCLAYLKTYPISALKIDRTFLAGIEDDEVSRSIVQAILDLARALKLYTVVEGVETEAHADVLKAMNAHYFQGYLYGRPVPPELLLERFASPVEA